MVSPCASHGGRSPCSHTRSYYFFLSAQRRHRKNLSVATNNAGMHESPIGEACAKNVEYENDGSFADCCKHCFERATNGPKVQHSAVVICKRDKWRELRAVRLLG